MVAASKKDFAKGVILLEIPNVGALGLLMSEAVTIGGIDWQVEMRQYQKEPMQMVMPQQDHAYNDEHELELRLVPNKEVRNCLWWCQAHYSVRYKFKNNPARKQWTELDKYDFHSYNGCVEQLTDLKKHWNLKNQAWPLLIAVDVIVKEAVFDGPPLTTRLSVNTETMLVNKNLLAAFSAEFNSIFATQLISQNNLIYKVAGVQPEQMQAFKMMIYGVHVFGTSLVDKELLDDKLAFSILKLATKYQFSVWKHCCEEYLIRNGEKDNMELLELAERENLEKLKEHCLAHIDPLEYAQNNQRNTVIYARLGKRTQEALNAKLEENAAKMRRSMNNGQGRNAVATNRELNGKK